MKKATRADYIEWDQPAETVKQWRCGNDENTCYWHVFTPKGIVIVQAGRWGDEGITRMEFISNGVRYCREWERKWQGRTIARLAREMVENIP